MSSVGVDYFVYMIDSSSMYSIQCWEQICIVFFTVFIEQMTVFKDITIIYSRVQYRIGRYMHQYV